MEIKFSSEACYGIISTDLNSSVDDSMLKLILALCQVKKYEHIYAEELLKDFHTEFKFELEYFPLQRLLNSAVKSKYFERRKDSKFILNKQKIEQENNYQLLFESQKKFEELKIDFSNFLKKQYNLDYSEQQIEAIISIFIEESGILLLARKQNLSEHPSNSLHFAKYVLDNINSEEIIGYLEKLIIGRTFSEYISYYEPTTKKQFRNACAYLDTDFVFRLLGVDNLNRKIYYENLVKDMKDNGLKLFVFDHTIREVETLIANSIPWIGNPDYDPSISNETTYYFVINEFSKDDVNEFCEKLHQMLSYYEINTYKFGLYPQNLPSGVFDEQTIYNNICDYYKATIEKKRQEGKYVSDFDEKTMRQTIHYDARSLFYISFLSNGLIPTQLSQCEHIFITSNFSLTQVYFNLLKSSEFAHSKIIASVFSEMFIGSTLWYTNTDKMSEKTKSKISAQLMAGFLPSQQLLKKLCSVLAHCEKEKTLTPEQCYTMKTNKRVLSMAVEITDGNENNYTEQTPFEVLKNIEENARLAGKQEEKIKADKVILEKDTVNAELSKENILLKIENLEKDKLILIKALDEKKIIKKDKIEKIEHLEKKIKFTTKMMFFVPAILLIIFLFLALYFYFFRKIDCISIPSASLSIFSLIILLLNKASINKSPLDLILRKKREILEYLKKESSTLEEEIDSITEKIKKNEDTKGLFELSLDLNN